MINYNTDISNYATVQYLGVGEMTGLTKFLQGTYLNFEFYNNYSSIYVLVFKDWFFALEYEWYLPFKASILKF